MPPGPPTDGPAEVVVETATDGVRPGYQAIVLGWTAPVARCRMTATAADGDRLVNRSTTADGTGRLLWLWTVRPTADPGAAALTVDCGGAAVTVRFEVR